MFWDIVAQLTRSFRIFASLFARIPRGLSQGFSPFFLKQGNRDFKKAPPQKKGDGFEEGDTLLHNPATLFLSLLQRDDVAAVSQHCAGVCVCVCAR